MAAKAKTASKNNRDARGAVIELHKYNGETVKPVLYIDRKAGISLPCSKTATLRSIL